MMARDSFTVHMQASVLCIFANCARCCAHWKQRSFTIRTTTAFSLTKQCLFVALRSALKERISEGLADDSLKSCITGSLDEAANFHYESETLEEFHALKEVRNTQYTPAYPTERDPGGVPRAQRGTLYPIHTSSTRHYEQKKNLGFVSNLTKMFLFHFSKARSCSTNCPPW